MTMQTAPEEAVGQETLAFQAETAKILDIVVHSLYSQREIFLRELISNASDACDRLRYAALTDPSLLAGGDSDFRITLTADKEAKTLTLTDNGIGMSREELIGNLGTIARSGTGNFAAQLSGDAKKDVSLIGQFGVGFYSAFMVADRVQVTSRRAGESHGWVWTSSGKGSFTVAEASDAPRGTRIVLSLKDDAEEFAEGYRLATIVKTYSDHIGLPVILQGGRDGAGEDETLNSASALWTRNKSEITTEQYNEFYHHVAHAFDEPWLTLHYRAEGAIEYTSLLFIPSDRPFDLFHGERKGHVKLYVNRVFITDNAEGLLPPWLRFLRGVVDSPDLPLNVSREMLQHQPLLRKIQSGLVKRVLGELKKKAESDIEGYEKFWATFGAVIKEGLHEEFEKRDELLALLRFRSTHGAALVSLADYVSRMKEGQEAIYTLTGEDAAILARSPVLEGFRAKGVEVLLLTDAVDEFWPGFVHTYDGKEFHSAAAGSADLGKIQGDAVDDEAKAEQTTPPDQLAAFVATLRITLGDLVKDVRVSERLTTSACCLVADEGGPSVHLERLLRQHNAGPQTATPRILEINASHGLVRRLAAQIAASGTPEHFNDMAFLLLDQARIVEGEAPLDPIAFAQRLALVMESAA